MKFPLEIMQNLKFLNPVYINDTICTIQNGEIVVEGKATVMQPK